MWARLFKAGREAASFKVTVWDERSEYANEENIPWARVIACPLDELFDASKHGKLFHRGSHVVVVTRAQPRHRCNAPARRTGSSLYRRDRLTGQDSVCGQTDERAWCVGGVSEEHVPPHRTSD